VNQAFGVHGSFAGLGANRYLAWSQGGEELRFTDKDEAKPRKWYHLTVTHDEKKVTTYLDGKQVKTASHELATGKGDLILGQLDFRNSLSGFVDEVRIYNRALSVEEVKALYDLDKPNQ